MSLVTTKCNLSSHAAGIPWDKFPRTMKDAMHLALELGMRFIWIDALCIVQDDTNDWKEQASQFGRIYENALFTVSATASRDAHSGCFSSQHNGGYQLNNRLSSMGEVDIYVRQACEETHDALFDGEDKYGDPGELTRFPILLRGWTFQERMLSWRMLHCGPEELAWECIDKVECECSCVRVCQSDRGRAIPETKRIIEDHLRKASSETRAMRNHPLRQWGTILGDYSSRQFTYPRDRLVALEGIAQRFKRFDMGSYLYGLWGKNIPIQLEWAIVGEDGTRTRLDLPTWSWASICGQCHYETYPFSSDYEALNLCEVVKLPTDPSAEGDISSRSLILASRVVDAKIHLRRPRFLDDDDPFQVKIKINGHLFKLSEDICQWREGSAEWEDMQADERLAEGQAVVCMELSTCTYVSTVPPSPHLMYTQTWLVLRQSSQEEGVYQRVGAIRINETLERGRIEVPARIQRIDHQAEKRTLQIK
ncbi:heterokaryon incompatibility protein-domain-containing protein [Aspergillus cavernicola]|uniref:Heterokaryon incompatibility protein-domain-containing protein n=1 Tax=Aspergillus cavernicola TaxID=176166 RepID=A0ABR4HLT8_9EURO